MAEPLPIAIHGDIDLALLPAPRQPPRPHHRRHRHRQDRDPAGHGRTLSSIGVPVFMADVKGDLAGMSQARAGDAEARRAFED